MIVSFGKEAVAVVRFAGSVARNDFRACSRKLATVPSNDIRLGLAVFVLLICGGALAGAARAATLRASRQTAAASLSASAPNVPAVSLPAVVSLAAGVVGLSVARRKLKTARREL